MARATAGDQRLSFAPGSEVRPSNWRSVGLSADPISTVFSLWIPFSLRLFEAIGLPRNAIQVDHPLGTIADLAEPLAILNLIRGVVIVAPLQRCEQALALRQP